MEIIHPEYMKYVYEVNKLRIKIAELITYRDSLKYHITKSLSIDYMLKIGALEYKLLQIRNSVEKDKRIIELVVDLNIPVEQTDSIINKEFLEQDCKLTLMGEAVNKAISDSQKKILSNQEIIELNSYYMPLVKDFSPEINLNISDEERLLFDTIKEKYILGNISEFKKFERFKKRELYFDELDGYKAEKIRLTNLIQNVNKENISIKSMYPYTEKLELSDENLFRRRKDAINKELYNQQDILEKLENKIKKLKK